MLHPVRVTLFHSPNAGEGVSAEALRERIERHGHTVVHSVSTNDDAHDLLSTRSDLVVAAGGDGTVASAARTLAKRGIPLSLLPMGTANNIALSLGVSRDLDEAISSWSTAQLRPFDLGRATGPWGDRWFVESVGGGLIARSISAFERQPADKSQPPREELIDAVRMHSEVLSGLKPTRWDLVLDGKEISGDYLLVAVLNIRLIGPNLDLCPNADPTDGAFSVALVGEEHRAALDGHLYHRTQEGHLSLGLQCLRARNVEIARGDLLHIDDKVFEWLSAPRVDIRIEPAAIDLLI